MLGEWRTHIYTGSPQFEATGATRTIRNEGAGDRGSWFAWWAGETAEGLQFAVRGSWTLGQVRVVYQLSDETWRTIPIAQPGQVVTLPAAVRRLRLDGRLWNVTGTAVFSGLDLELYAPEPEPEPDPGLPIPPPDLAQKHHVTGWKWGRNIVLMVHEEETFTPPTYVDEDEEMIPYEVKGWQHGRRLDLEIGNMLIKPEEEDEPSG